MKVLELLDKVRSEPTCRKAQEELYVFVRRQVLPYLARKITSKLKARMDAEDVLDEAYFRLLRSLDEFKPTSEPAFFAWVYRVARNVIVDSMRRRSLYAVRLTNSDTRRGGVRASGIVAPGRRTDSVFDRNEYVGGAIRKLDSADAAVIHQHAIQGKSFEEIAAAAGKTPGAVQRAYSRAVERLRAILERGRRGSTTRGN